jgi:hypothetical protein
VETVARDSKRILKFVFATALCAASLFSGCGRKGTAPPFRSNENSRGEPAEIPLEQQTEQKLDPLTRDDVELYLKVMRAAAQRVKTPAPGDTATFDAAKNILARSTTGRVPTHDDVMTLERASLVAISIDQIVAEEMKDERKLDSHAYRGIAEAIEAVVPNPTLTVGTASDDTAAPSKDHTLTPIEKRLQDVNAVNEKFLVPYRGEIQKLLAVVRNPANLPK